MTEAVQIALIASMPGTLAGVASLLASLRNHNKLIQIGKTTNGLQTKLLAETRISSHAEGMAAQRKEDKNENIPPPVPPSPGRLHHEEPGLCDPGTGPASDRSAVHP